MIIISKLNAFKIFKNKNETIVVVKIIEPKAPEYVLLGLILVSFGPLKIFPKTNPPISDAIHPTKKINKINFKLNKLEKKINIKQKINTKKIKKQLSKIK